MYKGNIVDNTVRVGSGRDCRREEEGKGEGALQVFSWNGRSNR